nr:hypothetical protein [Fodinicola acaciae]
MFGRRGDELFVAETAQVVLRADLAEQVVGGLRDQRVRQELRAALGDLDRPHLSGPGIHLAEDPLVDRTQVREVEVASQRLAIQPDHGYARQLGLDLRQNGRIALVQQVSECSRAGVAERILQPRRGHRDRRARIARTRSSARDSSSSSVISPRTYASPSATASALGSSPSARSDAST